MTEQILMDIVHTQSIEPHLYHCDDGFYQGDSVLHSGYGLRVVMFSYANKRDVKCNHQVVTLEHKIIF